MYNLFNHTQFDVEGGTGGGDTTARFDLATGAQVNASSVLTIRRAAHRDGVKAQLLSAMFPRPQRYLACLRGSGAWQMRGA